MKYPQLASALLCLALAACGGGSGSSTTTSTTTSTEAMAMPTPVVSISASPTATTSGQVITLTWSVSNAPSSGCTASGAWSGTVASSGTQAVTAGEAGTANYTLTCGSASSTAVVTVATPPPSPSVSLTLAPANITTAQSTALSWSSANATSCSASGAWSGTKATSGAVTITPAATGSYTYSLACTGDGGTANGSAALSVTAALSNSTAILVDSGPSGVSGVINVPYVSVTVCRPGTSTCQTIDHVLLDTGSYGLRLLASQLSSTLALPAVATASGDDAGECGKFISGYTWGAVRQADVKIADEVASGISVQVIGDSGASYSSTPSSCSSAGSNLGTLSAIGAKGILGVGMFKQDCGTACANAAISGVYYACASGSCSASAMPLARQISNPVASFAVNNNGLLITMPSVGTAGLTSVSGTLVFGVNTQSNNTIAGETIFKANSSGDFSTTYKGKTYSASFIDSGSNGYFFTDSTIRQCSGGDFYCPASTLSLTATNSAADGSASGTVDFNVVNLVSLASTITAAQVGGTVASSSASGNYVDWGMPFFYGRRVFVVMEDATVAGKAGPYWAY
ncbi:Protein of unknown function [Duganella sp. CF402]|uniref:DUF3443 family protein n=1 Tax=unclassified Duganella TaxID=2636909 RepID=UPI0008C570F8|nr:MULTISPECIES: DUF3443 family protein [unclassified Duganella]RZT09098.1 uncharacterized protein DUF3443 [Duganella sp. BK701]SEL70489.1 Protein of unknown function [Duganella sp. CF402]